jgi:hypothetical protein
MIIKIRPNGTNFSGALSYLLDKPRSVAPEVLDTNMVGRSAEDFAGQMEATASRASGRRAGPVWHVIVAWHRDDPVEPSQMRDVVQGLFTRLEIDPEEHQYVVVQHRDEDEPHLHVIMNRVGIDGRLFVGKWAGRNADVYREACEQAHGWTVARGRGNPEASFRTQDERHQELRTGVRGMKQVVHQAVRAAVDWSDGTWESFVGACKEGGTIVPDLSFNEAGFNGASFTLMAELRPHEPEVDAKGAPWIFKGSQIAWGRDRLEGALYARRQALAAERGEAPLPAYASLRTPVRRGAATTTPRAPGPSRPRRHFTVKAGGGRGLPVFTFTPPWSSLTSTARLFDAIFSQRLTAAGMHSIRAQPRGR